VGDRNVAKDLSKRDRGYPYGSDEETRPRWYPADAAPDRGGRRGSLGALPVIAALVALVLIALLLLAVLS